LSDGNKYYLLAIAVALSFCSGNVLAQDNTLAVTFYHYPPRLQVEDGQPSGLYYDQLQDVAKRAGYKIEWLHSDLDEEAAMLDAGRRAFCTTGRLPNKERALRWRFLPYLFDVVPGDTVLTRSELVEKLDDFLSITEVAKDSNYTGALLKSGIYGASMDQHLASSPKWVLRSGSTDLQLMKLVLAGRADWTIVPKQQWEEAMELHAPTSELVEMPDFGAHPDYPIYIACSRALSDEMFARLSDAMAEAGFVRGTLAD